MKCIGVRSIYSIRLLTANVVKKCAFIIAGSCSGRVEATAMPMSMVCAFLEMDVFVYGYRVRVRVRIPAQTYTCVLETTPL